MTHVERLILTYNNVYAIGSAASRVLIDTGPDYLGATDAIEAWLGDALPAVVVATHGHLDHSGLGQYWADRGVPVLLGEGDHMLARRAPVSEADEFAGIVRYAEWSGAPPPVLQEVLLGLEHRRAAVAAAYRPGPHAPANGARWPTELRLQPFTPGVLDTSKLPEGLRAIMSPGHTPGNAVVVHEEEGLLFSGDQLLPDITPTPSIQVCARPWPGDWRYRSLPHFLDSLRILRAIPFRRCYPGHGEPFDNVAEVIDANLTQIEERTAKVLAVLRESGEASVYALAEALYPRALQRRFWQIIATVQGHLDLLERNGQAILDSTSNRWTPVA